MSVFQTKASALAPAILLTVEEVLEFRRANSAARAILPQEEKLRTDVQQFCMLLQQLETVRDRDPGVISDMGEYGLYLLQKLADVVEQMGLLQTRVRVDRHILSFTLWVCGHGGALRELESVVNAFAAEANRSRNRTELEHLCTALRRTVQCVDRAVVERQDTGAAPWRLLNINLGIVATRSHNLELMRSAYEELIRNLPEEAPAFFSEGLQQMELVDYPKEVRDLVEHYYNRFCNSRTLH